MNRHITTTLLVGCSLLGFSQSSFANRSPLPVPVNSATEQRSAALLLAAGADQRVERRGDRQDNANDRVDDKQDFRQDRQDCTGDGADCRSDNRQGKRQDNAERTDERVNDRQNRHY